ncbi:MAG TPA: signal peptide peptidase SppA [Bryobacteraceae bacterium]|nr:signal peptide peptidase SppA [Bryobacteraceae bacterium]
MSKFLLGLITGLAAAFVGLIFVGWLLVHFSNRAPSIADHSVLVLRLSGDIPEKPPLVLPALLGGGGEGATIAGVWMSLKKAAADPRIKGIMLEPEGLSLGWARLEELRADIEQFRKSGKPVYAYLRDPGGREYYLALAADRIYLGPAETLMLKGLRAEALSFKNSLDKLGVTVQVEHAGKYKDYGDMFTRADMSPETREVLNSLLDDLYGNLVARIAAARKKSADEVRAIIDRGPFTAPQALQEGLVDELRFEDQAWGELAGRLGFTPKKVSLSSYLSVPAADVGLQGSVRIALVAAEGDIVRGDASDDGSASQQLTSYGFDKVLSRVANDSGIKGVIVRIDSPGGEVTASDEIWRQMNLLGRKKPLVISMSDVAASGGYYMAMTGDPIVAYPQTETGSIGVVYGKPVLRGLLDKLGISANALSRGKHADIDAMDTPLSPEELGLLGKGIDESYRDFVSKVAAARRRPFDQIEPVAQGRVWLGSQAVSRGLVDTLGGLDAAVDLVKKKAGLAAAERVAIEMYPAPESVLDMLMKRSSPEDLLETKLRGVFGSVPFHAWMAGGYLRLMPQWIEVR